jgi:hypothetical protein
MSCMRCYGQVESKECIYIPIGCQLVDLCGYLVQWPVPIPTQICQWRTSLGKLRYCSHSLHYSRNHEAVFSTRYTHLKIGKILDTGNRMIKLIWSWGVVLVKRMVTCVFVINQLTGIIKQRLHPINTWSHNSKSKRVALLKVCNHGMQFFIQILPVV